MENVEKLVRQTISKYKLCNKKEKILVALSGGKDSTATAFLLHKLGYKIEGFHIDLKIGKYSDDCRKAVKKLCLDLKIKLYVYDIKKEMGSGMCYLRTAIQSKSGKGKLKNCAICGVIKKWIMNKEERELKVDKIATGHNLDDEAQTVLMNLFKGSFELSSNSGAITKNIRDKKFIPRIKPLFYIPEEEVREYSKKMKLPVVYDKCPCANDSYRIQVRKFMNTLTDEQKENILGNFESIQNKFNLKNKDTLNYCENCGEPSRNKICKKCELMG